MIETLIAPEKTDINRMNDAKADIKGRLYFGTMNRSVQGRTGYLYSKEKDKQVIQIRDSVGISNGIAWNSANDKMFYIDTINERVDVMDYNVDTGDVCE